MMGLRIISKRILISAKIRATAARATTATLSRTRIAWTPLDGQRGVGHRMFFWSLSGNSYQEGSLRNTPPAATPDVTPMKPARCCYV